MSQFEDPRQRFNQIRGRLILSVIISGVLPLILYALLRPSVASDTDALALAGAIPVLWTIVQWLRLRRVDWINVVSVLGFAVAIAISVITGGSALALELREAVVASLLGLILLLSVLVGKPLLLVATRLFASRDSALASNLEARLNDPATRKRMAFSTVILGLVLLAKAAIDLMLALTLPTASFLATSRVINWAIIGGTLLFLWWMRHRAGGLDGRAS